MEARFMNEVRVVQDGARSIWIEGPVAVPRLGIKAVTAADLLTRDARSVTYVGDYVGRVDDAEVREEQAWVQAELDKHSRWLDRIRAFAERSGLTLSSVMGGRSPSRHLAGIAIEHRPTYRGTFLSAKDMLDLGFAMSPAAKQAMVEAEIAELIESLRRHGITTESSTRH
jgi:hypothetical protein